ncbi:MAG: nitric oxide synthase oxygenase [Balneolia bacterium]|nr:nitric oxide synthase oxygenase [Balneolia bacterium]
MRNFTREKEQEKDQIYSSVSVLNNNGLSAEELQTEIIQFLHQLCEEPAALYTPKEARARYEEILKELTASGEKAGAWTPTKAELSEAGRLAWRNSNRCIGRLHWRSLHTFDRRRIETTDDAYEALLEHLSFATNRGRIRSVMSVFSNRIRIHNPQLIRYAGFRNPDGSVTGDAMLADFTQYALELGWRPKTTGRFVVLPLVLQLDDDTPVVYELPEDPAYVLQVDIRHPEIDMEPFGLKWHALPVISNMDLVFGGIRYHTAPFNGYYMGTEVGARNLADTFRYNQLKPMAEIMKLDTSKHFSLWKDRALVELNAAVLHSFKEKGVKMVDHHTASEQYMTFAELEKKADREVTGEWSWLVPPVSGSTCPVFHEEQDNTMKLPNFLSREE